MIEKLRLFLKALEEPFVGRSEEARVITLALLTGEHAILVGEPGTAKSALVRRAANLLNARFFKYLLTKFTEPDELFGPLDITALREGRYVRITKNKLPEAEIAFIDEIFNANSAVLNMLLTLMNERIVYDGYTEIAVPLWTLISASNQVPDEPELQALYDRFLLRQFVKPIGEDKWASLLDAAWKIELGVYDRAEPLLSMSELRELNKAIFTVDLSAAKSQLLKLFAIFEDQGIHITDRRKGKALKVIAANALLAGRNKATQEDLFALKYVIPRDMEEADKVYAILIEEVESRERSLRELNEIAMNIMEAKSYILSTNELDPRLLDYLRSFERLREKVMKIYREAVDDVVRKRAGDIISEIEETIGLIKKRLLT